MDSQNIKVYLAISGALIVLLILIIVIPFTKKSSTTSTPQPTPYNLRPTTVETNSTDSTDSTNSTGLTVPAGFTGVAEEELPDQVLDVALQKKDLRQKTPIDLTTFVIDFDYGEDKFIVTLKDPKDQAQKEFESWRTANYPGLGGEQFMFR